jgi:hypothetical protein
MASRIVAAVFAILLTAGAARATPLATIPIRLFSTTEHAFGDPLVASSIEYSVWVESASNPSPNIGDGNCCCTSC